METATTTTTPLIHLGGYQVSELRNRNTMWHTALHYSIFFFRIDNFIELKEMYSICIHMYNHYYTIMYFLQT